LPGTARAVVDTLGIEFRNAITPYPLSTVWAWVSGKADGMPAADIDGLQQELQFLTGVDVRWPGLRLLGSSSAAGSGDRDA
jgi:hypothetical protein